MLLPRSPFSLSKIASECFDDWFGLVKALLINVLRGQMM